MRILFVNKYARVTGGADAQCLATARVLAERGHEVRLLSTVDPANVWTDGAFVPLTVSTTDRASLSPRTQARVAMSSLWNQAVYRRAIDVLDAFHPDLVIAHKLYPQLSVSPLVAARQRRVPMVIQVVHDYEFVSASPYDSTGRWWDADEVAARYCVLNTVLFGVKRLAHRRLVSRWIAVSRFVAARLAARGIAATVIPNFGPVVTAGPTFGERSGIAFAGRLSRYKGIVELLAVAQCMPDVAFRVAGDGPERPLVEAHSSRLPNLEYLGSIPHSAVLDLFRRSRLVVVSSVGQEPGALVTLDAMSVGTPLVVHDVGGIAEYVGDAGAGIVVPVSAEAMVRACRLLLDDEERWAEHSRRACMAASGPHSARIYCDRLLELIDEAVGSQ